MRGRGEGTENRKGGREEGTEKCSQTELLRNSWKTKSRRDKVDRETSREQSQSKSWVPRDANRGGKGQMQRDHQEP